MKKFISYINEKLILGKIKPKETIKVHSKSELRNYIEQIIEKTNDKDHIDLNHVDVSELNDFNRLFRSYRFKSINIRKWNVSNVNSMIAMFPKTLERVDISHWDVRNVKTMNSMFCECENLTSIGNISNWETKNLTDTASMFEGCKSLKNIDISGWDINKLTNVSNMFYGCELLESIGNIKIDLRNIPNSTNIFLYCKKLKNHIPSNY